jgi:hypothetical protein
MLQFVSWLKFIDVSEGLTNSIILTLIMEAVSTSETLVSFYETTWSNIPEEVIIVLTPF